MDAISKSILASKANIGNYLVVYDSDGSGVVGKIINREAKRGKQGYTRIKVLFGNKTTVNINSFDAIRLSVPSKEQIIAFQKTYEFATFGEQSSKQQTTRPPIIIQKTVNVFSITEDQMTFFKHADLRKFPCSLAELKVGFVKVCAVYHSDKGHPLQSDKMFAIMKTVYENLKPLCYT